MIDAKTERDRLRQHLARLYDPDAFEALTGTHEFMHNRSCKYALQRTAYSKADRLIACVETILVAEIYHSKGPEKVH